MGSQIFTSNSGFIVGEDCPSSVTSLLVELRQSGAGGGEDAILACGGGGSGGYGKKNNLPVTDGQEFTIGSFTGGSSGNDGGTPIIYDVTHDETLTGAGDDEAPTHGATDAVGVGGVMADAFWDVTYDGGDGFAADDVIGGGGAGGASNDGDGDNSTGQTGGDAASDGIGGAGGDGGDELGNGENGSNYGGGAGGVGAGGMTGGTGGGGWVKFTWEDEPLPASNDILAGQFAADEIWASMHFGICTNTPVGDVETGTGSENINLYWNPGQYDGFGRWLDEVKLEGAKGVMITAHYWEGFALWPSNVTDRNVANTTWYDTYAADPILDFVTNARARGLKVGIYYNIKDYYKDATYPGISYDDWSFSMLEELLDGTYGDIDLLFLDAWGDSWEGIGGQPFDDPDYLTLYTQIKIWQPNCILFINDHEDTGTPHGDGRLWERSVENEPPQNYTFYPTVALHDTLHRDSGGQPKWYSHFNKVKEAVSDISAAIARKFRTIYNGYVWFFNASPDRSGRLGDDTRNMLREMKYAPGNTLLSELTQTDIQDQTFSAFDSNWTRTSNSDARAYTLPYFSTEDTVAAYQYNLITQTDGRVEVGFIANSNEDFLAAATINGGSGNTEGRASLSRNGTDVTLNLGTDDGSFTLLSTNTLDNSLYPIVGDGSIHKVCIERRGTLLSAEFWTFINGKYVLSNKIYGISTDIDPGKPGFYISSESPDDVYLTNVDVFTGTPIPVAQYDTTTDLLLHYNFEETSLTTTFDSSGYGHDGTIGGTVVRTDGKEGYGRAVQFNGAGHIATPQLTATGFLNNMTIATWVNPHSFAGAFAFNTIFNANAYNASDVHFFFTNGGVLGFSQSDNGDLTFGTAANWPLDTWTHIAAVYDTTDKSVTIYVNGEVLSTGHLTSTGRGPTAGPSQIGDWAGGSRPFDGKIDDFRVYDRALTSSDVMALLTASRRQLFTLPGIYTGLSL